MIFVEVIMAIVHNKRFKIKWDPRLNGWWLRCVGFLEDGRKVAQEVAVEEGGVGLCYALRRAKARMMANFAAWEPGEPEEGEKSCFAP